MAMSLGTKRKRPVASEVRADPQTVGAFGPTLQKFPAFCYAFSNFRDRVIAANFANEPLHVQWIGVKMDYGAIELPTLFEYSSVPIRLDLVMLDPIWPGLEKLSPNCPEDTRSSYNRLVTFLRDSCNSGRITASLFGYRLPPDIHGFSLNNRWYYISWAEGVDGEMRVVGPEGYVLVESGQNAQTDQLIREFCLRFKRCCQRELFPVEKPTEKGLGQSEFAAETLAATSPVSNTAAILNVGKSWPLLAMLATLALNGDHEATRKLVRLCQLVLDAGVMKQLRDSPTGTHQEILDEAKTKGDQLDNPDYFFRWLLPQIAIHTNRTPPSNLIIPSAASVTDRAGETNSENQADAGQEKADQLEPAVRLAYLAYCYAESTEGRRLTDSEAHEYIKENGVTERADGLNDYKLPVFGTWTRYLSEARRIMKENKYTRRKGRFMGKSIVRQDEIELGKNG